MISLLKLQRTRIYWKIRQVILTCIFLVGKMTYQWRDKLNDTKESISITKELIKSIFSKVLLATVIISALLIAEKYILQFLSTSKFSKELNIAVSLLAINGIISSSSNLFIFITTIASISGIFLGLYFTAISVVASSSFSKVPSNTRDLLLTEKVGNHYINSLALLTVSALFLLCFIITGGQLGIISVSFISLFAVYGIFCFVALGMRTFHFFDPTNLIDSAFREMYKHIKSATIRGYRWEDPSFQNHYRKNASKSIAAVKSLIDICFEDPQLHSKSLSNVLTKTVYFLFHYSELKKLIPPDSMWYELTAKHESWFLTDYTKISLALESNTQIQPEMIPNYYWIEDEVMDMISNAIYKAFENKQLDVVYETLNSLSVYLEKCGSLLEHKLCSDILKKIDKPISDYFKKHPNIDLDKKHNVELVLIDIYGYAIISFAMGFFKLLRENHIEDISQDLSSMNWLNKKHIYMINLMPCLLHRADYLNKKLNYERKVEGTIISPDWYIKQLLFIQYADVSKELQDSLLTFTSYYFIQRSELFIKNESFILASYNLQRGMELINKIKYHFNSYKEHMSSLDKFNILKDLPWPSIDWDTKSIEIDEIYDKLIENTAKCIPTLSHVNFKDKLPDIFGQSYHLVCRECYDSLLQRNRDKFKSLFKLLADGSLIAHSKLREQLKDREPATLLNISFEPLLDIMELSGYSKVYSELYEIPDFWEECHLYWDNYLESIPNAKQGIEYLVALYNFRKTPFRMYPRDMLRSNWKLSLERILREKDLIDSVFSSRTYHSEGEPEDKHASALIRALCRGRYYSHISGTEIFIASYLSNLSISADIEFEDRWGLKQEIQRQERGE